MLEEFEQSYVLAAAHESGLGTSGRTETDLYLTQRPNPNLNGVPRRASTCSKASLYPLRWMSARRSRRRTCKQCAAVDATNLCAGQGDCGVLLSASKHDG
jgi:hypothetical protein